VGAYRLARGVRLQRGADGEMLLLVPEGIVTLSDSAGETLALLDGERDEPAIAGLLAERFDADAAELAADVHSLLEDFRERGYVTA
jgi:coenzyme PQQ biosynthesis protein PqqD